MNNAPDPTDAALAATQETSATPDAVRVGTAQASSMPSLAETQPDLPDPTDEVLVDQAGRPLGPRALQTRRKILDATTALLGEKSMRDMRVIDIARRIGSSPATFYQYFKDVEDVVLYLASQARESTPHMVSLIEGNWDGPEGLERGKQLVNYVIDHWEKFSPVLRARNNASDEGHPGLRDERMGAMMPLVLAFQRGIETSHAKAAAEPDDGSYQGGRVDPFAGATALTSCLERTSMYHQFVEEAGSSREALVETTATFLQRMLTSRR